MTDFNLRKYSQSISGPLLFIILDGVGLFKGEAEGYPGNALDLARAPVLKGLLKNAPLFTRLKAHGTAVGLPDDGDMGNSEVGHNAMGAGRIFDQGAKLVNRAIKSGKLYQGPVWKKLIGTRQSPGLALEPGKKRTVHLLGLLSDGNVHSHIDHLLEIIDQCAREGVERVRVHTLLDGRDVEKQSAQVYIERLEATLRKIDPTGEKYLIASGGGRMKITMDRYEADWEMVRRGWETHVAGRGRTFPSAGDALRALRAENPEVIDQYLPPFVIADGEGRPRGPIREDDIVIFFNFRGDRAIEISRAFTEENFSPFRREPDIHVHYAGMMEYDGDLKIPPDYLVQPPAIDRTVSEYLVHNGVAQFAISETQKYGHVTYFWNGNNSEKFDPELETWQEIPSHHVPFNQVPQMKAPEITDALLEALDLGKYRFLRVNFANGDMVGHTGDLQAAVRAVEAVDECLGRLLAIAEQKNVTLLITADHGNCDQMYEVDKKGEIKKSPSGELMAKTSHTLSPTPFILWGKDVSGYRLNPRAGEPGLGNLAATVLTLLGFKPPEDYLPSLVLPVE